MSVYLYLHRDFPAVQLSGTPFSIIMVIINHNIFLANWQNHNHFQKYVKISAFHCGHPIEETTKKFQLWCKQRDRHTCHATIQLRLLATDEDALFQSQRIRVFLSHDQLWWILHATQHPWSRNPISNASLERKLTCHSASFRSTPICACVPQVVFPISLRQADEVAPCASVLVNDTRPQKRFRDNVFELKPIRNGSKFIGYPGRDHRKGGEDFFRKKQGGADLFPKEIRGAETFFEKNQGAKTSFRKKLGDEDFFYEKVLKSKISFSKKAIFGV